MLLLCSFFRLKELFQVKNGLTTSLLFFFENDKNLGRSDDAKRRKKEEWHKREIYIFYFQTNFSLYMVHSSPLISYFEKLSTCI